MSILLSKHKPVLATSLITKASSELYRTEITKMKTQVSQLTTCVTEALKMNTGTIVAEKEEERRIELQQRRVEREEQRKH